MYDIAIIHALDGYSDLSYYNEHEYKYKLLIITPLLQFDMANET